MTFVFRVPLGFVFGQQQTCFPFLFRYLPRNQCSTYYQSVLQFSVAFPPNIFWKGLDLGYWILPIPLYQFWGALFFVPKHIHWIHIFLKESWEIETMSSKSSWSNPGRAKPKGKRSTIFWSYNVKGNRPVAWNSRVDDRGSSRWSWNDSWMRKQSRYYAMNPGPILLFVQGYFPLLCFACWKQCYQNPTGSSKTGWCDRFGGCTGPIEGSELGKAGSVLESVVNVKTVRFRTKLYSQWWGPLELKLKKKTTK